MSLWLQSVAANAIGAAILSLVALALTRRGAAPRFLRALWLLVLVKLVTPPLVRVPIPFVEGFARGTRPIGEASTGEGAVTGDHILSAVWVIGSLVFAWIAASRTRSFARVVDRGSRAKWIDAEIAHIARRLGVRRPPPAVLVDEPVPPCVFGIGCWTRIVLSRGLVERIGRTERELVLAHELVHIRRGDVRVRLFELVIALLYWWHPSVWIARSEMRRHEERCCDAQLLEHYPTRRRAYATALVDTVDYLAERPSAPLAPAFGERADLHDRMVAILERRVAPYGVGARTALFALALALPLTPALRVTPPLDRWVVHATDSAGEFDLEFESGRVASVTLAGEVLPGERWEEGHRRLRVFGANGALDFEIDVDHDARSIHWEARQKAER